MKQLIILIIVICQFWNTAQSQDTFRKVIHDDLVKKDYDKILEKINMNMTTIYEFNLLTFNEYWMINILCNNNISTSDIVKAKKLKSCYFSANDSLSIYLHSLVQKDGDFIKTKLNQLYHSKSDQVLHEIILEMLMAQNRDSFKSYQEHRNRIIKARKNSDNIYPDSILFLIEDLKIRNKYKGTSFELKAFISDPNGGTMIDGTLARQKFKASFASMNFKLFGYLSQEISFDFNLIEYNFVLYDYIYKYGNYYGTPEKIIRGFSEDSNFKVGLGFSYSLGANFINNQKNISNIVGFITNSSYNGVESIPSYGVSINTFLNYSKGVDIKNINYLKSFGKFIKFSISYDFLNNQIIIGTGIGSKALSQYKRINRHKWN